MNKRPSFFLVVACSFYLASVFPAWSLELVFGDFDDNGFEDLAMGCPLQSVFGEEEDLAEAGAVTVVYAGLNGLGTRSEVWHLGSPGIEVGAAAFDRFGAALAVGDFNGDGVADLAVGSPKLDESSETKNVGAVTILFGAAGDGLAQGPLLQAKHIRRRSLGSTPKTNDRFGFALAAGDFDRDGSDDLAIGVIGAGTVNSFPAAKGMVNVLYGPLFDPSQPVGIPRVQSWSQGDGPGELEVQGKAEEDDRFGSALATGDFDGDGFSDLAVGVPGEDRRIFSGDSGAVNVIYGSSNGLREARNEIFTQDKDGVKGESDRKDAFGSVLAVGNFNGDVNPLHGKPMDDLAVGIPSEDFQDEDFDFVDNADRGIVQVLYGSREGLSTADQILSEESPGLSDNALPRALFGFAIAVGNFNGDRHPDTNLPLDDLAVGIPGATIVDTEGLDIEFNNAGKVAILFGSEDLLTGGGSYYLNQIGSGDRPQEGDRFGMALAAGKAGSGGAVDLAVGVNDGAFGAAHVFYGTSSGPRTSNEEVFLCLEEGTPNQPGEPRIPGAIPGGPGEGVFHFVNPIAQADSSAEAPASDSAFSPADGGYLFQFEGEGFTDGWMHDNQGDSWDGLGISQFESRPGGVDSRELGGDNFVRIQDTGDPRDHGFAGEPSNRTITCARDLRGEFAAVDDLILDEGVTLHFRIRLATAFTGPLDGVHPAGGGEVFAVPVTGDGLVPDQGGFGHVTIHQGSGPGMGNVGFSLAVPAGDDPDDGGTPDGPGLVMNSLNGSAQSQEVDLGEGMRNNIHPVADPTQWQEFWITIQSHETFWSTHKVKVYHNGARQPLIYLVTAGNFGGDAPGGAGLTISAGGSASSSALDVDFLRVLEGVLEPATEPTMPLQLLAFELGREERRVNLAWQSNRLQSYCVEKSGNLLDWRAIIDGLPSQGSTTVLEAPLGDAPSEYFRVRLSNQNVVVPTLHKVPTFNSLVVRGVAVAPDGTVYFSDETTRRVYRIEDDGTPVAVAGGASPGSPRGDGGPATEALLRRPDDLAVGPDGCLYICDVLDNRVRKVDREGIITTVAGGGAENGPLGNGGAAVEAWLSGPQGIAVARDGTLYIADTNHNQVRRVGAAGVIHAVTGDLDRPQDVAVDCDGNLYIADTFHHRIVKVDADGEISALAGSGSEGYSGDGGPADEAQLSQPRTLAVRNDGAICIGHRADSPFHDHAVIRCVTNDGIIRTVAGKVPASPQRTEGEPALESRLLGFMDLAGGPGGEIYVGEIAPPTGGPATLWVVRPR